MKTFAIGDIHGCYDELMWMFEDLVMDREIINPEKDTVVFLGDYVDRGKDSKAVITQLMEFEENWPHWQFLLGNHEDLMLDALVYNGQRYNSYDLWWQQGGRETAKSYQSKELTEYENAISSPKDYIDSEHLNWLRKRPYYYETDKYFFVHAGVMPNIPLAEAKKELDKVVYNETQRDALWLRDQFLDSEYDWGKKIIFGHTPNYLKLGEPIIQSNKIGLDGAISPSARKNLLAVELPSETIYYSPAIK